jgi:hypothetical protein
MPTPEEDAAIVAAAKMDPDAKPLTDEQMEAMVNRSAASTSHSATGNRTTASGLRKGKIHAARASASEIRRAIVVTPAAERVAARALRVAATKPKTKSRARTGKKTGAKTRTKPGPKKR